MANIQWFPGHMTKALRMMDKEIKVVDIIIYVLDSRAPKSCVNPKLNEIAGKKPIIYVLGKADMVDDKEIKRWVSYFTREDSMAIALNNTSSGTAKVIVSLIKKMLTNKIENNKRKNITLPLRGIVVGVPNCGKSTLVNNLCGKGKAITGNKAGVTKGKQWVTIDNGIELLDTPGTLWPSFENQEIGFKLALIGSINDDILDMNELAYETLKFLRKKYKKAIEERYGISIDDEQEVIEIFDNICSARKCVLKGNEPDYDRCARIIIDDFRKGKFGKIILD